MAYTRGVGIIKDIDWWTVGLYLVLVGTGVLSIYSSVYNPDIFNENANFFDFSNRYSKQLLWLGGSLILILIIFFSNVNIYKYSAYIFYIITILVLIAVLFFGYERAGSRSWFNLGFIKIQPAEFAKVFVALALARYASTYQANLDTLKPIATVLILISIPALLIIGQGDTGSALVFGGLIVPLFRQGLPKIIILLGLGLLFLFLITLFLGEDYLIHIILTLGLTAALFIYLFRKERQLILIFSVSALLGIGLVLSENFILKEVLKPYQRKRIELLINPDSDPTGTGWQVTQSKIAIGSGGIWGKGFLEGTQTKYDFVPDQSTDFIFCTIGEEFGWSGSLLFLAFIFTFIARLLFIAERQKNIFNRTYGYGVAGILIFHYTVNIMMTIGLFPVIGIPLPFISYGGSSLLAFTILVFILLKLDAHRSNILAR